jgi:hypothetical protein
VVKTGECGCPVGGGIGSKIKEEWIRRAIVAATLTYPSAIRAEAQHYSAKKSHRILR